jgi:uncharacterized glyoxalase superfamily protein PhnB
LTVALFRVILPVSDIEDAARFYQELLSSQPGERVTSGRHYFDCGGVLLAFWDPIADGDPAYRGPNAGTVYLSSDEPLDAVRKRVVGAGATPDDARGQVAEQPWGERSFYSFDLWGNRFCIVQRGTEYRGGSFTFNSPTAPRIR